MPGDSAGTLQTFGAYGKRLDIVVTDNGVTGTFDIVAGLEIDAAHRWVLFYEADRVSLAAALKGDADFSGAVDFSDFLALSNNIDQPGDWFGGDFDGDGRVQFADFLILADNFGQQATAIATVPEPTCVRLAMIGLLGLIGRGRRR